MMVIDFMGFPVVPIFKQGPMWATSFEEQFFAGTPQKNGDVGWFITFYDPNYGEISCYIPLQNHKGSPSGSPRSDWRDLLRLTIAVVKRMVTP